MEYSRVEMHRHKKREKRYSAALLALLTTTVLVIGLLVYANQILTFLGKSLTMEEPLKKVDMIVVFAGSSDRIDHAIQLYKEGYAPVLFISGGRFGNYSSAERMRNTAIKAGVPEKDIIIDEVAYSTYDNAVHTVELARRKEFHSGIIVTSPYHMLRSMWIVNHITEKSGFDYKWTPSQSTTSSFHPNSWWKTPDMRKQVVDEFYKLVGYWFIY